MNLKEKVFVVTGGGNGIGREIVLNLLRNGAYVAALDLDVKGLNETKKLSEDHENLKTYELNITNLEAVEKMSETVLKDFGRVDGLINVAGIIQPFVSVKELDYGAIERVMNVNFYGTLYMVKSFLPFLLKDEPTRIVNVSSMGGFLPVPGQGIYGASKAAVKLMTEALYAELRNTNVEVTLVFPGAIGTNITANSNVEVKRDQSSAENSKIKVKPADEAASEIIKAMVKGKLYAYVGKDSKMMNFMYRRMPKKTTNLIAKKMASLIE
ncbi:MAG: SDR family oxidoreductase [Acholeplasmataceae bacterium]|nr:SDR family oxidoreductase [Acholeplasmataceae bacterium]